MIVGAAFGLGMMAGPLISGALSRHSLSTPAFVAAALAGANVLFGLLVLPESLPPERRTHTRLRAFNPLNQLLSAIRSRSTRRSSAAR